MRKSNEAAMRRRVCKALKPLHAVPIENICQTGTPDIALVGAWIECKRIKEWPKREETKVNFRHFTPKQKEWIEQHISCGGIVYVLLQIDKDWYLLDGSMAVENLGNLSREEMEFHSVWISKSKFDGRDLREFLVSDINRRRT